MSTVEEMENVSRSVLCCPQCYQENLPQWNYCAKCGAALWELCLRCGEPCAAGEGYCGACGACVDDAAVEQVARLEADFRTAAEMASAFRFDEAIALLACVSKNDHPRLSEYSTRAKQLITQLTAQRRRQQIAAEETCQRARQCFDAFDYDGAARFIENVPLTLQNDDVRQLRNQIAQRRREIDTLVEELRDAVRHKRLLELPPRIERLLALKPDHVYARNVAGQVQKRLVAAAKKMLAEHRYDQALRLLEHISVPADATDLQQFRRQAAELAWLAWDLRNAPVVDDTLLVVAERLRRLASDDTQTIRLCDELQRRIHLAKGVQRRQKLHWARPPEQTPFGVPVDWLTGFRRVTCAEALDRSGLQRYPGCFAIACGLALAGIKQAALQINLLLDQQQGTLCRAKNLMRLQKVRAAWGIDIGTSSLKAVKLAWNETKQQAVIESAVLIEHAKVLTHTANQDEETSVVMETLKTFLEKQQLKGDRVCVGLPGRMTLSRQIKVPSVDSAKTAKLVQFEAVHQFPFPLEQLAWSYQPFDDSPYFDSRVESSREKSSRVLLIAAKRSTTNHFLDAFKRLDVRVDVLQTDFCALHNFLTYDHLPTFGDLPSDKACPVAAALDIGCDVTNIVVSSPQSLWFRSCGVAGHSFTRALVKEFNLSITQAEQQKRSLKSAERLSDIYEALSPIFDDLLKEVRCSLTAYAEAYPDRPFQQVVALSGGLLLHGLFRYLRCGR